MSETISRNIQIDNWIFEVKMVRALRVDNYGDPYTAIANISLNGNSAYIDGMMQKNHQKINDADVDVIKKFCQKMTINQANFEQRNCYRLTELTPEKGTQLKTA
ncbi:MAG: pyridoxine 5'-phosphate synthase PdxJ [Alteromonadaceae bacterium]|jgi:pyridoxine 5'-phosphate synthase PdxJ|tara:strand:- start:394 stop:705 length:312 start_codon:yes stop_codon:yes gene_type:complete